MSTAQLSAFAALFALAATSAIGGECCGNSARAYAAPVPAFAPVTAYGVAPAPIAAYGTAYGYAGNLGGPRYGEAGGHQPGGYPNRLGSPYYYSDGVPEAGYGGDVYSNHFGPGFHRHSQFGHYRFPYYSYRRPWYHVGPPAYNADTNFAW